MSRAEVVFRLGSGLGRSEPSSAREWAGMIDNGIYRRLGSVPNDRACGGRGAELAGSGSQGRTPGIWQKLPCLKQSSIGVFPANPSFAARNRSAGPLTKGRQSMRSSSRERASCRSASDCWRSLSRLRSATPKYFTTHPSGELPVDNNTSSNPVEKVRHVTLGLGRARDGWNDQ